MSSTRRILRLFGVLALFTLCFGLIGGVLGIADAMFDLGLGKLLFESESPFAKQLMTIVVGGCFFAFLKTFFPQVLSDLWKSSNIKSQTDIPISNQDSRVETPRKAN